MRIRFDQNADALYLRLDPSHSVSESEEVRPGIIFDYDSDNRIVGIEILGVKDRIAAGSLKDVQVEVA